MPELEEPLPMYRVMDEDGNIPEADHDPKVEYSKFQITIYFAEQKQSNIFIN